MALDRNTRTMTSAQAQAAQIDVGLRQYMLRVYNYMTGGLILTGAVSWAFYRVEFLFNMLYAPVQGGGYAPTILAYAAMFAPLAFVLVLSFGINRMRASTAQMLFWLFAAVMGMSLANIFMVYTGESIVRVFFISAATFAAMSLYGYTTKKDLASWGSFLFMGLIGIIIAMVVNIFLVSSALDFVISAIGVLVFTGLAAYDTQRIKSQYRVADGHEISTKKAVYGALSLYLDFINLFLMLLRLLGNRE